jgi:mono/diheme cytochrome c family protein
MTKLSLSVAIVLLVVGTAMATTARMAEGSGADTKDQDKTLTTSQAAARRLYLRDCSMCHGETGNGQTDLARDMQLQLSDLGDPKTLAHQRDDSLFWLIRNGKSKMPPEAEERAKDDEIRNLIQYVRDLSKSQTLAPHSTN